MSRKLPTAVHETKGTARADRQHADEPQPPKGAPAMPVHLSDAEKIVWHEHIARLEPMGVLTEADGLALEQLVVMTVEVRDLTELLRSNRTTSVKSTQKEVVDRLHPLYPMLMQGRRELRALWGCFGLDPQARTSVHIVQRTKKNDGSSKPAQPEAKPAARYFN